jgi:2-keto-3-deoxy-L-fuconate dehydrogenase
MFSLQGKTALVTGSGSGIGRAIAHLFAKQGAHVVVVDVSPDKADEVVAEIVAAGGTAIASYCDIGIAACAKSTVGGAIKALAKLDILVNNAGVAHVGTALTTTEEDLDRLYAVNIKGMHLVTQAALPKMIEKGGGVILNLCSIAAMMGLADRYAYSMTKGAVLMMTYSVAKDYIDKGIRCNCICPARVHTPFVDGFIAKNYPGQEAEVFAKLSAAQPIGRMAQPEEIAALALYLCSDEAGFVTGSAYPIDGGAVNLR